VNDLRRLAVALVAVKDAARRFAMAFGHPWLQTATRRFRVGLVRNDADASPIEQRWRGFGQALNADAVAKLAKA
jgi:hypothetical protein